MLEAGELGHHVVRELAPDRRQDGDAPLLEDAVDRCRVDPLQSRTHDVDANHHPGSASVRRVIHLPVAARRVVAQVEHAQPERARPDRVCHRARLAHPVELGREQRHDVELERHRKSSRIVTTRSDTSTTVTTSSAKGMRSGSDPSSGRTSRTSFAG